MNSKRPRMDGKIALHQILDYMPSSGESEDDSDDPVSGIKDTLDNFTLSSSSSDDEDSGNTGNNPPQGVNWKWNPNEIKSPNIPFVGNSGFTINIDESATALEIF